MGAQVTVDLPTDERTLVLVSRDFGVLDDPERGYRMWTNYQGQTYVGAIWWAKGQGRLYANVPAETVTVEEWWSCVWPAGYNTECLEDARDERDGFHYCPRHAQAHDILTAMDAQWGDE